MARIRSTLNTASILQRTSLPHMAYTSSRTSPLPYPTHPHPNLTSHPLHPPNSSAPSDILLLTPPISTTSLLQYRLLRGTLDFYFFTGPTPIEVTKQYAEVVGLPVWVPYWSFGFHLCRWGYGDVEELREQVRKMREVGVPLESECCFIGGFFM